MRKKVFEISNYLASKAQSNLTRLYFFDKTDQEIF